MNPCCRICNAYEEASPFLCSKCKHNADKFDALEKRMNKAESENYWAQEKLQSLLREVSPQIESGAENINVPRQLLQNLFDVAFPHEPTRAKQWTDTIIVGSIVCDACDMLRARGTKMFPRVFGMLKKHVEEYFKLNGWKEKRLEPGTRLGRNIWDAEPIN